MARSLEDMMLDGSIPDDVYRVMRDAIRKAGEERGRLFEVGQEAHYQALAAFVALKAAGYTIRKSDPE